jgi:hypothetical protein
MPLSGSRSPPGLPTGPHDPLSAFEMTRLALLKVSEYIRGQAEAKSTTAKVTTPRVSVQALGEKFEL